MKIAAIFPGQGSQHPGMGQFLFENFSTAKHRFEEASDTLKVDFKKLCFEGSEQDLALTENTQPALLLVSTCCFDVLQEVCPVEFAAAAGHSVGEYAAIVAGKSLGFSDGIGAVRTRGQAMQSAVPVGQGGMVAAMGLTPDQVDQLCDWAQKETGLSPIEPANFNAPGQIVLSGNQQLIDWLQQNFTGDLFDPPPRRCRLIPLKVSAPFHCSMMKPAQKKMAEVLSQTEFSDSKLPIIQNVNALPINTGSDLRENLVKQVSSPVRWVECIETLKTLEVTRLIELGPGQVLNGLVKKIDKAHLSTFNMNSLEDMKKLEEQFSHK